MKRSFLTFFGAVLLLVTTAQTSKSGGSSQAKSSYSKSSSTSSNSGASHKSTHTYSSSGATTHHSSTSTHSYPKSTIHTYSDPVSTTDNSTYNTDSKITKTDLTVAHLEMADQHNTTNVSYTILPYKYKKSSVIDDSYRTEKGGINRVGLSNDELVNYQDRYKVAPVNSQGDNSTNVTDTANTSPEGLSSAVKSQNPAKNSRVIINCDYFSTQDKVRRIQLLNEFEYYDLTEILQCHKDYYPKDNQAKITCDEFEKSSEERKNHIIAFAVFYDLTDLKNCATYLDFIKK
jgi:hypothetical protein